MLAKRIIACLDVNDGQVVKGIRFKAHQVVGDILELAHFYCNEGVDELVFYDITASCDNRVVDYAWVSSVAKVIDIPFCVAGGIRTLFQAEKIFHAGADKISINSPALENPNFITELAMHFGSQSVVLGVDSKKINNNHVVCQYTGRESKLIKTIRSTESWLQEIQQRGAGEIVLNCMDVDGLRQGYDLEQLLKLQAYVTVPLVASGGAGSLNDFLELFNRTHVSGALAASVFHQGNIQIPDLKQFLYERKIEVRYVS